MPLTSIGDQSRLFAARNYGLALRTRLDSLTAELSSGRRQTPAMATTRDAAHLFGLDRRLAGLAGYRDATAEAATFAAATQVALGQMQDLVSRVGMDLAVRSGMATPETESELHVIAAEARGGFADMVQLLESRIAGRSLFSGVATDRSPLADADTMLAMVSGVIAGKASVADIERAVDEWFFAPGGGFETDGFRGGAGTVKFGIADRDTVEMGPNAADGAFRESLKGLAMAALADDPALSLASPDRFALADRASLILLQAQTGLIQHSADLGQVEARLESRATSNAAEKSALEIARSRIADADPYETAIALQAASAHLETFFTVTARASRLSLVEFLR